jgi:hypothetical protein
VLEQQLQAFVSPAVLQARDAVDQLHGHDLVLRGGGPGAAGQKLRSSAPTQACGAPRTPPPPLLHQ